MQKMCKCGKSMQIHLRTIVYSNKIEIMNVPIFTCDDCHSSEVFHSIKGHITEMIEKMGNPTEKQTLMFNDVNELAHLMYKASDRELLDIPLEMIVEDRINELLDLLILARSIEDDLWVEEVQQKLIQITNQSISVHDFS